MDWRGLDAVAGQRSQRRRVREIITKLHDEIVAVGNEPSFRQKRLIDIGIVPVFDSPEQVLEWPEANS
jgi:hypothetical protein